MTEFLYLQTLQHTGTWFVLHFVCEHPEVGGFVIEENLFGALDGKIDRQRGEASHGEKIHERAVLGKKTLLFGHVACHSQQSPPYLCPRQQAVVLNSPRPLVVPLRDPLLAMITHEMRIENFKETRLYHKITGWRLYFEFLTMFEKFRDAFYFPVDILKDKPDERLSALKGLQVAYGLENEDIAKKWVDTWGVYNSYVKPEHPNKVAYANRDLAYLEKTIPHSLVELRKLEGTLRPILERWYKDLLWWS